MISICIPITISSLIFHGTGCKCEDRASADVQSKQSATNDVAMSVEDAHMIKSFKLAAELIEKEIQNLQDSRLTPIVEFETTAGLGT